MTSILMFWFTIVVTLGLSGAAKVLVVFPFPGKSHGILGDGYVRVLLEAGHEVTYITPFPSKDPHPNLRQVNVSDNAKMYPVHLVNIKVIMDKKFDGTDTSNFLTILLNIHVATVSNDNVQKILNNPNEEFDVIIVEWLFTEIFSGLSVVFNCPYIWSSSVEPHWAVLSLIDEALSPAYNSDAMVGNTPPFSFTTRVYELWIQLRTLLYKRLYFMPIESKHYEEMFGPLLTKRGKVLPLYEEVRLNASLMLGNSHYSLGQPTRLPQSYKPIGGYHIDPNVKPLPKDLKKIIGDAKNGVIYFSMGTNFKSKDMPEDLKKSLLKIFGELKYTFIWKFEENLANVPENVHILQWAPQPSILSHPNCVLFITHGGLLSTTEAVHFGVPIIGIPVLADQFINVKQAANKGFAKKVDLSYTMAGELKNAIEDVLSNPKYTKKARELSMIYHDRVAPPGRELAHWVEHVVRTRGARHLRSPALLVPWYQKMYLDLAALVIVLLIAIKYLIVLCFSKKRKNTHTVKKNN